MASPPTPSLLRRVLAEPGAVRALVVGDVMLDRYLTGEVERISPEAPVPVLRAHSQRPAPGGAANVALGIRALGAACELVGLVGDDGAGRTLRKRLERRGLDAGGLVVEPGRPTTVKLRVMARHQQMLRIDREETAPPPGAVARPLRERAVEAVARADVVVLEDYDKGAITPELARTVLAEAGERGVPSIVDPKLRHFFEYAGADVFKPNGREVAAALGREHPPDDVEALRGLSRRVGCRHLIVTLGERGMWLLEESAPEILHIPSRAREVYDVSGAGDTVTAVLAVGVAAGAALPECASLANFAAGLEVARLGARPVSRRELLARLGEAGAQTATRDG